MENPLDPVTVGDQLATRPALKLASPLRGLRERYPDKAIVIAADNDVSLAEGQGRNPGLINGQKAAGAIHAELLVPRFSDEEIQAGMTDFNDLASHDELRKSLVAKELEQALAKAFALQEVLARSQQVEAAPAPAQSSAETEHEEETLIRIFLLA